MFQAVNFVPEILDALIEYEATTEKSSLTTLIQTYPLSLSKKASFSNFPGSSTQIATILLWSESHSSDPDYDTAC